MILIVFILLSICIAYDCATSTDEIAITNTDEQMKPNLNGTNLSGTVYMGDGGYIDVENRSRTITPNPSKDKIYYDYPVVTMTGRPSCTRCAKNHRAYVWSTHTYIDYCPNCHHYNCLINKHKRGAIHEKELTCKYCDSDFCVVCGKEKYSWSSKNLRHV